MSNKGRGAAGRDVTGRGMWVEVPCRERKPKNRCPGCGVHLHNARPHDPNADRAYMQPGDFSICPNCGALLGVDRDSASRLLTPEEINEIAREDLEALRADRHVRMLPPGKIRAAIQAMKEKREPEP